MRRPGVWMAIVAVALPLAARGAYLPTKAWLAQRLLERAWQRARAAGEPARPWPWADTWPVARLEAPAQGLERIVLAGGSGRTMAFGPGHVDGTAPPGAVGNCVVVGHRDTHFAFLARVRVGEPLVVEGPDGERTTYRVVDTAVVDRDATWVLGQTEARLLTLVTCYPFSNPLPGGRLRYVVWAVGEG